MGNSQEDTVTNQNFSDHRKLQTQLILSDSNNEEIYEELEQKEPVCLCCIKGKTIKKKITWESRFITNCEKIQTDLGYTWIDGLIQVVRNNELPKINFVKEVQNLRKQKLQVKNAQNTILLQPEEVQKFKKNLKKSVIISFAQNNQTTKSTGQFAKSSLSSLSASIMMRKSRFKMNQDKKIAGMSGLKNEKKLLISRRISGISRSNSGYSEDFGVNKEVAKHTATELEIFLKFCSILQRHLGEINCILGRLRKQFVYYFELKFKDSVNASRQLDLVIETVQVFIVILNAGVMDYYNLRIFAKDQIGSNIFISNEENVSSSCTSILFRDHQFYNCLFSCISYSFKEREERFSKIINFLAGSGPQRFQVKDKFCLNVRTINSYLNHLSCQSQEANIVQNIQIKDVAVQHSEPYKACMIHLNEMTKSRSPINKLKCLMACSEGITFQIQKFYDMNSFRKQRWMLDADQMLSIFCYLLVGAKIQHLHTHLFLLDNFASSLQMISMTGYYLSVMHCAVQQLQNEYGKEIDESYGLQ